ncbi:pentapeptide repeat-containing protein [Rhodoplanes sp. SY1]|uniref:pentapeptide repeat-containing protein n=1 Tax=Rhodoplanes sp. SY1 TaxID=3166646 RepID=UPI0038B4C2AF
MRAAELRAAMTAPLTVGHACDLRGLVVDEPLDLGGARIGNVDLTGTRFEAPVIARGAVFGGLAWFRDCRFAMKVDFAGAVFGNDARFDGATFLGDATFSGCEFHGVGDFDLADFHGAAFLDRLQVLGNLSLERTRFRGPASFEDNECFGGLWCHDAQFDGRCNTAGMEVHGRTWLTGVKLPRLLSGQPALSGIRSFGYRWS